MYHESEKKIEKNEEVSRYIAITDWSGTISIAIIIPVECIREVKIMSGSS